MSELDAFEAKVRQNIKLLSAADARTRRTAARWLGEAGDPSAITRLRQVYEEDPDSGVRQAAEYSLGMFRALEEGLNGPKHDDVVQKLEDIALKGKMGRRSPLPRGLFARLNVALLVSLVLLLLFNFVIWPQLDGQLVIGTDDDSNPRAANSNVPQNRDELLGGLTAQLGELRADVETLRSQYIRVIGGDTVDCSATFINPNLYSAASIPDEPDLRSVADELNIVQVEFESTAVPYRQFCAEGTPLSATEAAPALGALVTALDRLTNAENMLSSPESTEPDAAEGSVTEEPSPAPPSPTPNLRPSIVAQLDLIDEMLNPRGAAGLLNSYWIDIRDTGATDGCSQPQPDIPANRTLAAELGDVPAQLTLAVDLVNNGLALLRQGWSQLQAACTSGDARAAVETGLNSARNASGSFELARDQLNALVGQ